MGTVAFDMVIALVIASFASASALSASCAAVVDTSCGAGVLDSAKANASSAAAVVDKCWLGRLRYEAAHLRLQVGNGPLHG